MEQNLGMLSARHSRPEGSRAGGGSGFMRRASETLPHQLEGPEERCKLLQWVPEKN